MGLLQEILKGGFGETPDQAKCLAHLVAIVKCLGWNSFVDTNEIKPNTRSAQLYIRKNACEFTRLYGINFNNLPKHKLIDTINPILIKMWHVQIIGDSSKARLELLRKS